MDLSHPFILGHYHLKTPDITGLSKRLKFWVFASIKGGMIVGEKRVGKSYAIEFVGEHIAKILGTECYSFVVNWKRADRFNEKTFWKRLLGATGYDTTMPGDPDRIEQRFYERVLLQTEEKGAPVAILFIDDAQRISVHEFQHLCHAFNELEERKIRLYTFLFGQHELEHTKTLMREANVGEVIARFMQHTFVMRGIATARSLKSLLTQLDNLGFTADAAPKAHAKGFRLADIAGSLWAAKTDVDRDYGIKRGTPWTMQQFQSILAVTLQSMGRRVNCELTQDDLAQIIKLIMTDKTYAKDDSDGD